MTARRAPGTAHMDRLRAYGGSEDTDRPTVEQNREAAARWTEARRRRLGRGGDVDLEALRDGRMGKRRPGGSGNGPVIL